jgi:hypothetical protein
MTRIHVITYAMLQCLLSQFALSNDIIDRQFKKLVLNIPGSIGIYHLDAANTMNLNEILRESLDAALDEKLSMKSVTDSLVTDAPADQIKYVLVIKTFNGYDSTCLRSFAILDSSIVYLHISSRPELTSKVHIETARALLKKK